MSGGGRIYISGPMRGYPGENALAFRAAASLFREKGWNVTSPDEMVDELHGGRRDLTARQYIEADIRAILECDAVALLPGWIFSTGARCEVAVAVTLGLELYHYLSAEVIHGTPTFEIAGGYEFPPQLSLDALSYLATLWANNTFTQATQASRAAHLYREAQELEERPDDISEAADCFILLAHLRFWDPVLSRPSMRGPDSLAETAFTWRKYVDRPPFIHYAGLIKEDPANHDCQMDALVSLLGMFSPQRLALAVAQKLTRNMARTWGEPDSEGVVEHVSEGSPDAQVAE